MTEAEAEAEVEIEAEVEAEVTDGAASAAAGVAAAAAAVGSQLSDGDVSLSDVATAIDGASSTSTSTFLNPGENRDTTVETGDVVETISGGPVRANTITYSVFGEAEIEVEAEAEAEAEVGNGVAAAAATGATGVAAVGNYAVADAATSAGTATSAAEDNNAGELIDRF